MKLVLRGCGSPFQGTVEGVNLDTLSTNYENTSNTWQELLKSIHGKFWLACDCQKANPPIFTIKKRSGHYFIAEFRNGDGHTDSCANNKPLKTTPELTEINFGGDTPELLALTDILTSLLSNAHCTSFQPDRTYSQNIEVLLADGVDGLCVNGKALKESIAFGTNNFKKAKENSGDDLVFLFDVVDSIEKQHKFTLLTKHYSANKKAGFRLFDNLTVISSNFEVDIWSGPFAVLIACQNKVPTHAVYVPVHSKSNWFPLVLTKERDFISRLTKSIAWYSDNTYLNATLSRKDATSLVLSHGHDTVNILYIDSMTSQQDDNADNVYIDLLDPDIGNQLFDKSNVALKALLNKVCHQRPKA